MVGVEGSQALEQQQESNKRPRPAEEDGTHRAEGDGPHQPAADSADAATDGAEDACALTLFRRDASYLRGWCIEKCRVALRPRTASRFWSLRYQNIRVMRALHNTEVLCLRAVSVLGAPCLRSCAKASTALSTLGLGPREA